MMLKLQHGICEDFTCGDSKWICEEWKLSSQFFWVDYEVGSWGVDWFDLVTPRSYLKTHRNLKERQDTTQTATFFNIILVLKNLITVEDFVGLYSDWPLLYEKTGLGKLQFSKLDISWSPHILYPWLGVFVGWGWGALHLVTLGHLCGIVVSDGGQFRKV